MEPSVIVAGYDKTLDIIREAHINKTPVILIGDTGIGKKSIVRKEFENALFIELNSDKSILDFSEIIADSNNKYIIINPQYNILGTQKILRFNRRLILITTNFDACKEAFKECLMLKLEPDLISWCKWALKNKIHTDIIGFVCAHPNYFKEIPIKNWYVINEELKDKFFYRYAGWNKIMKSLLNDNEDIFYKFKIYCLSSYINLDTISSVSNRMLNIKLTEGNLKKILGKYIKSLNLTYLIKLYKKLKYLKYTRPMLNFIKLNVPSLYLIFNSLIIPFKKGKIND